MCGSDIFQLAKGFSNRTKQPFLAIKIDPHGKKAFSDNSTH